MEPLTFHSWSLLLLRSLFSLAAGSFELIMTRELNVSGIPASIRAVKNKPGKPPPPEVRSESGGAGRRRWRDLVQGGVMVQGPREDGRKISRLVSGM